MDYRSLVNKLEAIQNRIDEAADTSPEAYKRAQAAMARLEQAAKYSGTDEIVRSRMGLPAPLPPIESWDGTQPAPVGKPDWFARVLGTGGGATGDVQQDQDQAAATNTAIDGAATRSNEFIAQKLKQLTDLVAKLKGGAPVAESIKISAKSLVESLGYTLYEGGVTLPAADGSTPPGAHTGADQVALNQSMGKKALIQQIQALMGELADIEDPAVHAALADAQAAIDGRGKEQDRARMKELISITQKPAISQTEMEESKSTPSVALSEGERMAALRAKLDELNFARLPGMANKATEVLPKVIGKDVAVPPGPMWNINKPTVKDMGMADVVPKPALGGTPAIPKIGDAGFDFKKASKIAAGAAAGAGATYMAATGNNDGTTPPPLPPTEPAGVNQSGQAATGSQKYTIQRGDTLSALAKKNGVSVADIMKANPSIKDPNRIMAGAPLNIPTSTGNPVYQGGAGAAPAKPAAAAGGGSKTDLTKFYADEMKEMETLIAKYASDPEMADDVKAAQTQLDSLKATAATKAPQ